MKKKSLIIIFAITIFAGCITQEKIIGGGESTGIVSGRAVLSGSAEHSGTTVGLAGTSYIAVTDSAGNFKIYNVAPGTYTLVASRDGYESKTISDVQVNAGEEISIGEITLNKLPAQNNSPSISSIIAEPAMVAPGGTSTITCTATDLDGDTLTYTWSAGAGSISGSGNVVTWTAPNQNSVVANITVEVSDNRGGNAKGSVMVATQGSFPGMGSVEGYVTLFGEEDSSGINISLLGTGISGLTDATGFFSLTNVPQGTYTIEGSLSPYQPKQRNNIIVTGNGTYNVSPFSLKLGRLLYNSPPASIQITPDRTRIVFVTSGALYSQASDGSSGPVLLDTGVGEAYQITPDSLRVVYVKGYNLYSSPITNSAPVLIDTGVSWWFPLQITPDSVRMVYSKRSGFDLDIYSSPVDSSNPVQIDTGVDYFITTPDVTRVVYRKSSNLYSSSITSSSPVLIDTDVNWGFQITPDSMRVVYAKATGGDLYSSPVSSSSPVLIDNSVSGFMITPDSTRAVYRKNSDLYSSPVTSSSPVLLDSGVYSISGITPDSNRALYFKQGATCELYSTPVTSSSPLIIDSGVDFNIQITPDSSRVVYPKGGCNSCGCFSSLSDLYSSPVTSSSPVQIDTRVEVVWDGYQITPQITPDSSRIMYHKPGTFLSALLYFRVIDGSKKARAVDDYTGSFAIASDGSFFVYSRYTDIYPQSLDNGIFRVDFPAGW